MVVRALLEVAEKSLVCHVCYSLLRSPVVFSCGHVFCRKCAERSIEERPRCPLCNHTVGSRRVITPLPTLARLMLLIHDVTKSLRLRQPTHAATAPNTSPLGLGGGRGGGDMAARRMDAGDMYPVATSVIGLHSSSSTGSDGDGKMEGTPVIQRASGMEETQFLRTPLPQSPPLMSMLVNDFLASDNMETQRMFVGSPIGSFPSPRRPSSSSPSSFFSLSTPQCSPQYVAVRRCSNEPSVGGSERIGCCVLCGLDIKNRAEVRHYLRQLLHSDPTCDPAWLHRMNEVMLGELLGPMWSLHPTSSGEEKREVDAFRKRGRSESSSYSDSSWSSSTHLVHQSCLEWCVLRDRVHDNATLPVVVTGAMLRELNGHSCAAVCSFCSNHGRCLVPCGVCYQKAYHYPCALLTGTGVCNTSSDVVSLICGTCLEKQKENST